VPTLVSPRLSGAPVLIYHPDAAMAEGLRGLVHQVGRTAHMVDSIGTAFEYAEQRNPLSMAMICVGRSPHCTGLVWARTVRQINPMLPIVVLALDQSCPDDESVTVRLQMPFQQDSCITLLRRYLH